MLPGMPPSIRRTAKVLSPLVVMLGLLTAPASASAFDFGVRGWWPLNEGKGQTVKDWSGNRNHGFLGATPNVDSADPSWIKGIFYGSGLNFGGDDFVQIKDSNSIEPKKFTLSLWVRAPQSPGQFSYLIAKGSNECLASSYGLWTASNGGIEFYIWNGSDTVRSNSAIPERIWDGRWHNVTATYDGTSARLFIDGEVTGDPPGSSAPIDYEIPEGTLSFGAYRGSCDLLFSGDIDQVMLFSSVLPVEQIWDRWGFILNRPTYE